MVFEQNLEENLVLLHEELDSGSYQPGRSLCFIVKKPKLREIFAADFRDRVVHHVLVGHLEPQWERRLKPLLWDSGLLVGWVGETGRRLMSSIAERALICRWVSTK